MYQFIDDVSGDKCEGGCIIGRGGACTDIRPLLRDRKSLTYDAVPIFARGYRVNYMSSGISCMNGDGNSSFLSGFSC